MVGQPDGDGVGVKYVEAAGDRGRVGGDGLHGNRTVGVRGDGVANQRIGYELREGLKALPIGPRDFVACRPDSDCSRAVWGGSAHTPTSLINRLLEMVYLMCDDHRVPSLPPDTIDGPRPLRGAELIHGDHGEYFGAVHDDEGDGVRAQHGVDGGSRVPPTHRNIPCAVPIVGCRQHVSAVIYVGSVAGWTVHDERGMVVPIGAVVILHEETGMFVCPSCKAGTGPHTVVLVTATIISVRNWDGIKEPYTAGRRRSRRRKEGWEADGVHLGGRCRRCGH